MNNLYPTGSPTRACNDYLDGHVDPRSRLLPGACSPFRVSGYAGLVLAVFLSMSLVTYTGISPRVMVGISLAAVSTFFGLAMLTKLITGEERLVYYRHEIVVIAVVATLLWLWRQPVLPYLDATILGVGVFLACGRLGCLMVGCCHGVPHRWGVCYGDEHARAGFTPYYVGVRLFPIQAIESAWVLGIVVAGSVLVLGGYPPGTALAWYVVAYGLGRFGFEFMRGDPERSYLWGFSEAQWTSLLLMLLVVCAEVSGLLEPQSWHTGATAALAATMIAVATRRRFRGTFRCQVLHPGHVREVAGALGSLSGCETREMLASGGGAPSPHVRILSTSLGVQISAGRIGDATDGVYHYALSRRNGVLLEEDARRLAALVIQIKHPSASEELVEGNRGVFHLLVESDS